MITKDKLLEVVNYYKENGEKATLTAYGLQSASLYRYLGDSRAKEQPADIQDKYLLEIKSRYSEKDLAILAKGKGLVDTPFAKPSIGMSGDKVKFGFITDTHIGSKYTSSDYIVDIMRKMEDEGCEFIAHAGDVTEGMSHRQGHVYELTHVGYTSQKEEAIRVFSQTSLPVYAIDGNHDRWFYKSVGAKIVHDISEALDNFMFLGHDEGNIMVGGVRINLWHGEDGSSYAYSYRPQKVIESLHDESTPDIMLMGHVHKYISTLIRGTYVISGGSVQQQSKWMRSTRKEAHVGFNIIEFQHDGQNVISLNNEFYGWKAK